MSFELIRSFMEAIDANRIENSGEFKYILQTFPTLGKDLQSLLTRQDYARFLDFCSELLDANKNQKTSPLFPALDRKSIAAILSILRYMKNEEPNLVNGHSAPRPRRILYGTTQQWPPLIVSANKSKL